MTVEPERTIGSSPHRTPGLTVEDIVALTVPVYGVLEPRVFDRDHLATLARLGSASDAADSEELAATWIEGAWLYSPIADPWQNFAEERYRSTPRDERPAELNSGRLALALSCASMAIRDTKSKAYFLLAQDRDFEQTLTLALDRLSAASAADRDGPRKRFKRLVKDLYGTKQQQTKSMERLRRKIQKEGSRARHRPLRIFAACVTVVVLAITAVAGSGYNDGYRLGKQLTKYVHVDDASGEIGVLASDQSPDNAFSPGYLPTRNAFTEQTRPTSGALNSLVGTSTWPDDRTFFKLSDSATDPDNQSSRNVVYASPGDVLTAQVVVRNAGREAVSQVHLQIYLNNSSTHRTMGWYMELTSASKATPDIAAWTLVRCNVACGSYIDDKSSFTVTGLESHDNRYSFQKNLTTNNYSIGSRRPDGIIGAGLDDAILITLSIKVYQSEGG